MRTEVRAYLSETLFAQTDELLWRQAAQAAAYPGMIGLYCEIGGQGRIELPTRGFSEGQVFDSVLIY